MDPDAKKHALFYIGDIQQGEVRVFTYPGGLPAGTLSFGRPEGMCTDAVGDIWIASVNNEEILEFPHGGTDPIRAVKDPGEVPFYCSVSQMTGDLAVSNFPVKSKAWGSISIYTKAKGKPRVISSRNIYRMYSVGYDDKNNLFMDGLNKSNSFRYGELSNNGGSIKMVSLDANIETPGNIQWDGRYMAVGDQNGGVIYRTTGSKVIGITPIISCVYQFVITKGKVIAPVDCLHTAKIYDYPEGGSPIGTIGNAVQPFGAAVSYP